MIEIDKAARLAQALRYEQQAAELPEGSPQRAELLSDAASLRADVERGYALGVMSCKSRLGGAR